MNVELRSARPADRQLGQPGVELLVGGLVRVRPRQQIGAADPLQMPGNPADVSSSRTISVRRGLPGTENRPSGQVEPPVIVNGMASASDLALT